MLILGIDPGLSAMGVALYDSAERRIMLLRALSTDAESLADRASTLSQKLEICLPDEGIMAVAVEWQQERGPNDRAPADDIINLCGFAGMALGTVMAMSRKSWPRHVFIPRPRDWKGTAKKHLKQNQIVQSAGLANVTQALLNGGVPLPRNMGSFTKPFTGIASEPLDALGLALWAAERIRLQTRYGPTS